MSLNSFSCPTWPVASQSYKCAYCIDRIAPGTKHLHFKGVWEGDFQSWRMHLECEQAHGHNYTDGAICEEGRHLRGFTCLEMAIVRRIEPEEKE